MTIVALVIIEYIFITMLYLIGITLLAVAIIFNLKGDVNEEDLLAEYTHYICVTSIILGIATVIGLHA